MPSKPSPSRPLRPPLGVSARAFTALELLVMLAVLSLLVMIVLPVRAGQRSRSQQAVCLNNLRQIGAAFQAWGHDHGDRLPFYVPVWEGGITLVSSGASPGPVDPYGSVRGNAWFQFSWISNGLPSPAVLACPSDMAKKPATTWGGDPATGLLHPNFQNNAVSYIVTHGWASQPNTKSLLCSDRNLRASAISASFCSLLGPSTRVTSTLSWTGSIHSDTGNILSTDGSVEETTSAGLERESPLYNSFHFIAP